MMCCKGSDVASQLYMKKCHIKRAEPKKHANIESKIKTNFQLPEK